MRYPVYKRIISLLLVTMLLLPCFSTMSFAQEKEEYPYILVPGIMSSDIYLDTENPDAGLAWPPSTDSILNLVTKCIPPLLEFSITKNWDNLGHSISPLAYDLFEPALCNPDGSLSDGTGIIFEYPEKEDFEKNKNTIFHYDWRADPVESAAELDKYIDYVLEMTDSDKVAIECHSLGGIITLSYCTLYGYDKIDAVAFNSCAIFGESYTGDLLSGDMVLSNDSLMSFMSFVSDATEAEDLLNKIFDILECAGLGELIADMGNDILENLSYILLPEVVVPLFARWLTIWAMVPDDKIDEAMAYTFENYITDDLREAEILKEKIENYNTLIRDKKTQTLLDIDSSCKVGVIARYGYSSIPATSSWQEISDGIIDTKNASFGATVSLYGSTLSDEIISNTPEQYISPDKTVNAATCLFPEKTWFIKGTKHSAIYEDLDNLVLEILYNEEELNVDSLEAYPRFLVYDFDADSIIPDNGESEESSSGLLRIIEKIKNFIADFFNKLRLFFGIV